MKRYQVVDSASWQQSICSVMFASNDESVALEQASRLGIAMGSALEVIDAWDASNHFPNVKPLLATERDVSVWLQKYAAQQKAAAST